MGQYKSIKRFPLNNSNIKEMQQDTQSIKEMLLPRRSARNVGTIQRLDPRNFTSNYYQVTLNSKANKVYMYEVKLPADIPNDSTQIFIKCILQIKGELKKSISYICFSGKIVYGFKKNNISQTYQCKINDNTIEVQIKFNKQLSITSLLQDPQTRPSIFQFLNSNLKTCMRDNNICEMGKVGAFYPKNQINRDSDNIMNKNLHEQDNYAYLENVGLSVLRGYKFTLAMINRQMKLQLDVCSRVLQSRNLLDDLADFVGSQQQLLFQYRGKTIITRYGNYKTYNIQDLDFGKTPQSTFESKGEVKTFRSYFKKAYGIDIHKLNQPLIKVKSPMKRQISKDQKVSEQQQYIYLIPELVSLTGMSDSQRANHQSMKALAPFTKLNPNDRFQKSSEIINLFNGASQILTVGSEQNMKGYLIPYPRICLKEQTGIRNGLFSCRGDLLEPHYFKNWAFVYSARGDQDYNQACQIQESLRHASRDYGIKYQAPTYIEVRGSNIQNFIQHIHQTVEDNGKPIQIVFIILKQKETTLYGKLKNYLINTLGLPSQIIQAKSLTRSKNVLSIASKVAIQMNCKAGSAPWVVLNNVPYFQNKKFGYASISTSKGKGGFTVSFVGTINNECTKVYSQYALKLQNKETIDASYLKNWFIDWIKAYYKSNKNQLPQLLILFRESAGQSQSKHVVEHEVTLLKSAIQMVCKKTKSQFAPEILYIFVNKKINSRFYATNRGQYCNPQSGSTIIQSMSADDQFDFHLVAQHVTQGTCTPTHYVIGYDGTKMPQEDIVQFTYNQCYNYFNWQGTVKVPSMLQCADKLSRLAGQSIKSELKAAKDSKILKSYYFL